MLLVDLPTDVFEFIFYYLDSKYVFRLLQTGSSVLSAKIAGSVREVDLEVRRFDIFPFTAFNFRKLRHFSVYLIKEHCYYPLTGNIRLFVPPKPMIELRTLKLVCAQSLAILDATRTGSVFSSSFPNITSLHLSGSNEAPKAYFFKSLPESLLHLTIGTNHIYPSLHADAIQLLPRGLLSFEYHGSALMDPDGAWPPSLTSLKASTLDCDVLCSLPPNLKTLDSGNVIGTALIQASLLPKTLEFLRLETTHLAIGDKKFPFENLRFMHVEGFQWRGDATVVVKDLNRDMDTLLGASQIVTDDSVEFLPENLKKLILRPPSIGLQSISAIPQNLTWLSIREHDNVNPSVLPRMLTHLEMILTSMSDMPPSLTELKCLRSTTNPYCPDEADWKSLSPSLTALEVPQFLLKSVDFLSPLPNLESLTTIMAPPRDGYLSAQWDGFFPLWDQPSARVLKKLRELRILGCCWFAYAWYGWLHAISEYKELRNLEIQFTSWYEDPFALLDEKESKRRSDFPISIAWLVELPDSLRSLSAFWIPALTEHPKALHSLPPRLSTLLLPSIAVKDESHLDLQHYAGLPHSLTRLSMPKNIAMLPEVYSVLPPLIRSLAVPGKKPTKELSAASSAYFSESKWGPWATR